MSPWVPPSVILNSHSLALIACYILPTLLALKLSASKISDLDIPHSVVRRKVLDIPWWSPVPSTLLLVYGVQVQVHISAHHIRKSAQLVCVAYIYLPPVTSFFKHILCSSSATLVTTKSLNT